MHIWHFEVGIEQRKLGRKRTEAQLYIEDDDSVYLVGNAECFVDLRIRHSQTILTVLARTSLRGNVDVLDRRHHGGSRIRRVPFCHFRLKLRDHHILRVLTEHSHPFGIKITVVRDDAMERQNGTRERIWRLHGPELLLCRSGRGGRGSTLYSRSAVVRQLQHFFVICDPIELWECNYVCTRCCIRFRQCGVLNDITQRKYPHDATDRRKRDDRGSDDPHMFSDCVFFCRACHTCNEVLLYHTHNAPCSTSTIFVARACGESHQIQK